MRDAHNDDPIRAAQEELCHLHVVRKEIDALAEVMTAQLGQYMHLSNRYSRHLDRLERMLNTSAHRQEPPVSAPRRDSLTC